MQQSPVCWEHAHENLESPPLRGDYCTQVEPASSMRRAGLAGSLDCRWCTRRLVDPRPNPAVLVASSSRSQVAVWTASCASSLTWQPPSVNVRWRPPLAVAIVPHLVTRWL